MGGDPVHRTPPFLETTMRHAPLLSALIALSSMGSLTAEDLTADVAVYGGTPAGIAAALAAGRAGKQVVLIEPYSWVGGLVTNGLTHTDYHVHAGLTGTFLEFTQRVETYYRDRYGADSLQVAECRQGTQAEPSVNRLVFERMLAEVTNIRVLTRHTLTMATLHPASEGTPDTIRTVMLTSADGGRHQVSAAIYLDASYEGDLMAQTRERWRVGREGRDEFQESLAPAAADDQLQAYNFRLTFTNVAANRVAIPQPAGYRREDFTDILPLLEQGVVKAIYAAKSGRDTGIYKAQVPPLPNGQRDINDVSSGAVRLSMPGANHGWPDGDATTRRAIFTEHLRYNLGLLYFLQNDAAVPQRWHDEANEYGLCRDEFTTNGHLPEQLYVREARRLLGQYVYTQNDTTQADGDHRAVLRRDAIAIGEYSHNCHGTAHEGSLFGGKHTGEFYLATMPYQIPYGVIVPRQTANLLVPVAVSASHVGFCALRLEPIWTSLGQAAGEAAVVALEARVPVQQVDVARLQRRLQERGSATIYTNDVPPAHPDFIAVQWWGTLGGMQGLEPRAAGEKTKRPRNLIGQYNESYPFHDFALERALDAMTAERWTRLAAKAGVPAAAVAGSATRGEFIRRAFAAVTTGR
jgi:hypothetical protein